MKKEILQTVDSFLRRAIAGTMVVCALMVSSFSTTAEAQQIASYSSHPEIKYLGEFQGRSLFQIDLQTTADRPLYVSIKDDQGIVLFNERIRDNKFTRKFAFEREEFEGRKLSFVIHDADENTVQTYQVTRSLRVVEDVVITRL